MTKRHGPDGPGMLANAMVNAMADAINGTNQYNHEIELSRLRAESAALRSENTQAAKQLECAMAELDALRPLKPIAEAGVKYITSRKGLIPAIELDYSWELRRAVKAYLAAQEGGTE